MFLRHQLFTMSFLFQPKVRKSQHIYHAIHASHIPMSW